MSTYPSLTLCPHCHARNRRHLRGLLFAAGILGLIVVALLLSSCSGGDSSGGVQPPPRRTLSEIRAEALGETQAAPTPALAPVAIPTAIIPAALPADEVDWAAWALSLSYRWCAIVDGQPMLMGGPDGPRPVEPALLKICPQ